jgi:hypothetical protein
MPIRAIFRETTKLLGFRDGGDLLSGAFGVQAYSAPVLKYLLTGTLVASLTAFCTHWIWNPPSAILLLLFLDLANGRYGYQVAKKLKGEPFKWSEFRRMGGIMVATIITMGIVRNAINSYSYYEKYGLADAIFCWLFVTKAQKVLSKMVALRVQEQGAASLFQLALKSLLQSKLGPILVDSIQTLPKPTAPAADTPPVTSSPPTE